MIRAILLWLCLTITPLWAVTPDEVLKDPELEARARTISKELRCLVCRNESVDESNATFAKELRLLVRERVVAGDTNEEAIAYLVDRYGEYVLLNPRATGSSLILWFAGPGLLIVAVGTGLLYIRRRRDAPVSDALDEAEQARLKEILEE